MQKKRMIMTVKIMKFVTALCIAACIGTVSAQQTVRFSLGQQETSASSQAESDVVKVQGRGVGEDREAALKDAYRDAIERAVGLYVDADVVVDNDQIMKDQVLTQSNAYITECRELGTERIGRGLMQVRILATVKKLALTAKLTSVMPPQTVRVDNSVLQSAHAQLVTKEKRAEDSAALLKNALDGLNPMKSLMVAGIRPETQKILTEDMVEGNRRRVKRRGSSSSANQVTLRYLCEVKLDRDKYFAEFVPPLKKVLEQISLSKPKEIRLTELMEHPEQGYSSRADLVKHFISGNESENGARFYDVSLSDYDYILYDPAHAYSILWQGDNLMWGKPGQEDNGLGLAFMRGRYRPRSEADRNSWKHRTASLKYGNLDLDRLGRRNRRDKNVNFLFAMITSLNADCSNGKVTIYELDKSMIEIIAEWRTNLNGRGSYPAHPDQNKTSYNIIFLDKDGEEIGVYPWQIPNGVLMNLKFAGIQDWRGLPVDGQGMVYATPFVGCFGENLIQWRDFILEKDQLAKVASIRIESAD